MRIRQSLLKGTFYIALAKYSGLVVSLVLTSILARILTPSDYGVIAIAMVFITFFTLLSDMGIGSAIVQYKDLSDKDVSSIFGLSFWVGLVLAVLFFVSSFCIASFYDNKQLILICQILSIQVLFVSFNMVPNALLLKEQKFKVIAIRTLSIQIFCGILAVWTAFNGWGLYSLLIAPVLGAFLTFAINLFYSRLKISFLPAKKVIRKIASFSIYQFLFGLINYFGNNLHSMLIGKVIGMGALGYYEKGDRLIAMPIQNVNGVLSPVLHPVLSNYQDDKEMIFNALLKMTKIFLIVSIPIAVLFFVAAKDIVLILLGNQWTNSVPCIQILSFTIVFRMSSVSIGAILQTLNKTNLLFKVGLINVIIAISALVVSVIINKSIESICFGAVVSSVLSFLISFYVVLFFAFNKPFIKNIKIFIFPIILYLLSLIVCIVLMWYVQFNPFVNVIWKSAVIGLFTLAYMYLFTDYRLSCIFRRKSNE